MLERRDRLKLFGVAIVFFLTLALPHGASARPSLSGKWGCLATDVVGSPATGVTVNISQLIQFKANKAGKIISGTILANRGGEVCSLTITGGSYSIGTGGVGTLQLNLTIPPKDQERQAPLANSDFFCAALFDLPNGTPTVTQNYDVITVDGNTQLHISSADDFLTNTAAVSGDAGSADFSGFAGRCLMQ
jgi:hypothetical protein